MFRKSLLKHFYRYPKLQYEDIFKFIFHCAYGCEHHVVDENSVLDYILKEVENIDPNVDNCTEYLNENYCRVHLSWIKNGLSSKTLAKLFCKSAVKEADGKIRLEEYITVAKDLIFQGLLPFDSDSFDSKILDWKDNGYPPVHHSADFREAYHPAYRVVANKYADFLDVFAAIDRQMKDGSVVVAIDGGSASGKSTLAEILSEVYDCNLIHMDYFFLRPEQRTPERFNQIGGNIDKERFFDEVIFGLKSKTPFCFRPFDCSTQTLGNKITIQPKKLTVVEGVYSMHPEFSDYYTLAVFLDIDSEFQKQRIVVRNSSEFANRFFNEWIPLENKYFEKTKIKDRADLLISIREFSDDNM